MKLNLPCFCALCNEGPLFGLSSLCHFCSPRFDHQFLRPQWKSYERVSVHSLYSWREEDDLVSKMVYLIKESRRTQPHKGFAQRMIGALPAEFFLEGIFIPIPSSTGRKHSELLAGALSEWTGLEVLNGLDISKKERQPGKTKQDRKARKIEFKSEEIKNFLLSYKTVILVDDVVTTGSTMEAASRILKPSQRVYGLTLFRRDLSTKFATY